MTDMTLEEQLQHIQQEKQDQEAPVEEKIPLEQQLAQAQQERDQFFEITKKAQFDYLNLKTDFDRLQRMSEEKLKTSGRSALVDFLKAFLIPVDQLRVSLDHIDESQKDTPFAQGIQMVYQNMMNVLEKNGVKAIASLGLVPDGLLHEPISALPVEDEAQKGKIIQEVQRGYMMEKDGEKIVILSSKVIVGN